MESADIIATHFAQHREAFASMDSLGPAIAEVAMAMMACLQGGGTVYTFGNGGSAADAQHLTAELVGHYRLDRRPLRAMTLTTDASVWTAISNDFTADQVFARQVQALARHGDLVCAFSTTGRSPNVIAGMAAAQKAGATTVLFGGTPPGPALEFSHMQLLVPSSVTPRIQEMHTLMVHVIADIIDNWAAAGERA